GRVEQVPLPGGPDRVVGDDTSLELALLPIGGSLPRYAKAALEGGHRMGREVAAARLVAEVERDDMGIDRQQPALDPFVVGALVVAELLRVRRGDRVTVREQRLAVRPERQFVRMVRRPEPPLLDLVVDRQDDLQADLTSDLDPLND